MIELRNNIQENPPDIIAVTEVKPKNFTRELTHEEFKIEGYEFEPTDLSEKDSCRGVALYIRSTLSYRRLTLKDIAGDCENTPTEIISIELPLENHKKALICIIYRSPTCDEKEDERINRFFWHLDDLKYSEKLIVGDFNRRKINWELLDSPCENDCKFIEASQHSYLIQHQKEPTRGRGTDKPSLIDLVFTTKIESIESIETTSPLGKSDHSLLKFKLQCKPERLPNKTVLDFSKLDKQKMHKMLDIDWEKHFEDCNHDLEKLWEKFVAVYEDAVEACIPKKIVKSGIKKYPYRLDRIVLSKKKRKYRLWKRFLETKDGQVYEEYCRYRNQVRRMTRKAEKKIEKEVAESAKTNSKKFWKFINSKTLLRAPIPDHVQTCRKQKVP